MVSKKDTRFYESYTYYTLCGLLYLAVWLGAASATFAQCENTYSNVRGNDVLSKDRLCAPNNYVWSMWYEVNKDRDVKFVVFWGDGDSTISTPTPISNNGVRIKYSATLSHNYVRKDGDCNYSPSSYLMIDGKICTSSIQAQKVTVWDIDSENGGIPRITPDPVRVCWGTGARVTFKDQSQWNCTPATGENDNINNIGRWVQWIYGTENTSNSIPGLLVDGNPEIYDNRGAIDYLVGPIETPNAQSLVVDVPNTTTQTDVGKVFEITLRNWNVCNPYDANIADGDPNNPTTGNMMDGDSIPIYTTATIIIVDKVVPDFNTTKADGSLETVFCINETINIDDLTSTVGGATYAYAWKFFDDATGLEELPASTAQHPNFKFSTTGRKMIELSVTDTNSEGNCNGTVVKYVDIVTTADAAIQVAEDNGQPINSLCLAPADAPIMLAYEDVSTDFEPATSLWQWDFYHWTGTVYHLDSTKSGTVQASFSQKILSPGSYMSVLTAFATNVDCYTQDTSLVHVYAKPVASFTANAVCLGDSTAFTSTASLPQIINGDAITLYEWDINNDGTFEYSSSTSGVVKHQFTSPGIHQVAHRVTTAKGSCAHAIVQNVEVKPVPKVSFTASADKGCASLEVTFTPDVAVANQPVAVDQYIWHIKDLKTHTQSATTVAPADTFTPPAFVNTQSAPINHTYEVWLEADASNSCNVISDTITITVYPAPSSEFTVTNSSGADANCSPRTYTFEVTAATRALSAQKYHWKIIDTASGAVVVTEEKAGNDPLYSATLNNTESTVKRYTVELLAEHSDMCFIATSTVVAVSPLPSSAFAITPLESDCRMVSFEVEAEQKGLVYNWQIFPLPTNTPDLTKDKFVVEYPKTYGSTSQVTVRLQTSNILLCQSAVTEEQITVQQQETINARFSVTPSILEIPARTVTIIPQATDPSFTYLWDFGDGTTSSVADPGTHTYSTFGEYWVKVWVAGNSCLEQDSARVIIKQTLPKIDFDYSLIEGCLPLTVDFINKTQYGDTTTYFWSFGDGSTSTDINPSYTYHTSGIYTVSLQASNKLGVVVNKEKQLIIDLSQGPKAVFDIRLAKAYLPNQDITFSNKSQNATSYFWSFGDGSTSPDKEPVHRYDRTGHYDITLVVQNDLGCTDTLTKPIFIQPLVPEVDFSYAPPTGCRPLTVQFKNLSRYADPKTYRWSFGEGQGVSTEENPSYTYYEPGLYTITLEASNSMGVTDIEKKEFSIEVYDNPIAAFNLRPDNIFLGENIYLVNLSTGASRYSWDFGDGTVSTESEPVHTYQEAGTYDITLMAENEHGCSDTIRRISAVIVEKGGKIQVPNAFTPSTTGPGGSDASTAAQNDVFLPVFEGVTSFHMMIFNRWGELLFESFEKGYGWDGYYKGKICPKDVYVYKLDLKFSDGRSETKVGDLTLLR